MPAKVRRPQILAEFTTANDPSVQAKVTVVLAEVAAIEQGLADERGEIIRPSCVVMRSGIVYSVNPADIPTLTVALRSAWGIYE